MAPNVGLGTQGPIQRGWGLWLTSVIAVVLAAFFVLARVLQRLLKTAGLGLDDYTIIASLVTSGLLSLTESVVYGYGREWTSLPVESRITARKWFYAANIVYKVVLLLNKASIVCLYYRIFAISSKSFRVACHVVNGFIIISGLAYIIATIFQCTPIAAFWDKSIPGAKCFSNEPWWISYAAVQISQDVMLMVLPLRRIATLSMTRMEKIGLSFVFGTGTFVTFTSIYRATTIATSVGSDPTWDPIPATIWSVIEANAGIICACLPMLRHPFLRLFGPLFGSKHARSKAPSYRLNSRSNPPSGASRNARKEITHTLTDLEQGSEERIMGISHGSARASHERVPLQYSGARGIVIRSEFSVTRSEKQDNKENNIGGHGEQEKNDVDTLRDDKVSESERSAHMHV